MPPALHTNFGWRASMGALEKGGEASMTGTLRDHWAPDSVNTTLILLALCPGGAPGAIGRWGICRHFARDEGTSPRDVAAMPNAKLVLPACPHGIASPFRLSVSEGSEHLRAHMATTSSTTTIYTQIWTSDLFAEWRRSDGDYLGLAFDG